MNSNIYKMEKLNRLVYFFKENPLDLQLSRTILTSKKTSDMTKVQN